MVNQKVEKKEFQDPELQIENGNYTRILNNVLEELVKMPLLGAEMAICLFIIRKTWGYQKTEDNISITQFEEGVAKSRPTIVKALKNLQLVNMVLLVDTDDATGYSYKFNKKYNEWINAVKTPELVKGKHKSGKGVFLKVVKTPLQKVVKAGEHTKEIKEKKEIQKTGDEVGQARLVRDIIEAFGGINPACKKMYGNITQRQACIDLIETYTFERVMIVITKTLPKTNGLEFFPTITTPHQLFESWTRLEAAVMRYKSKGAIKKPNFY